MLDNDSAWATDSAAWLRWKKTQSVIENKVFGSPAGPVEKENYDFSGLTIKSCAFQNVMFTRGNFENATFLNCTFLDVRFEQSTNFQAAQFSKCRIENCLFSSCNLDDSKFDNFGDSIIYDGPFSEIVKVLGRRIEVVWNYHGLLSNCTLIDTSLVGASGFAFNASRLQGCNIGWYSPDPWSVLSRNYSGSRVVFHVMFLVFSLGPFILRAAAWVWVNRIEQGVGIVIQRVWPIIAKYDSEAAVRLSGLLPCTVARNCQETNVWRLLVGLDDSVLTTALFLIIVIYNLCRFVLVFSVSGLNDEVIRSLRTPTYDGRLGYRRLYLMHLAAKPLLAVSLVWLGSRVWEVLSTVVLLPR